MSSKIEQIIEEIEEYIDGCKPQTLSKTNIIVNKEEIEELLRELRMKTPEEIKRYQKVLANRDAILADAQAKADAIIKEANIHTSELINEHEIMQQAYIQANEIMAAAEAEAQQRLRALYDRQDFFERRLLHSFPSLRSSRHPEALKKLREHLASRKKEKM